MPKYQSTRVPEKEKMLRKRVTIKNGSTMPFEFKFDNELYCVPPMTQTEDWNAEVACFALGDPDLRPGMRNRPLHGDTYTWEKEMERLQHMHGAWTFDPSVSNGPLQPPGRMVPDRSSIWQAIKDGKIRCPEFGRGPNYYSTASEIKPPMHIASDPLVEDDERRRALSASRRMVAADPLDDDDDVMTPPQEGHPAVAVGSL